MKNLLLATLALTVILPSAGFAQNKKAKQPDLRGTLQIVPPSSIVATPADQKEVKSLATTYRYQVALGGDIEILKVSAQSEKAALASCQRTMKLAVSFLNCEKLTACAIAEPTYDQQTQQAVNVAKGEIKCKALITDLREALEVQGAEIP